MRIEVSPIPCFSKHGMKGNFFSVTIRQQKLLFSFLPDAPGEILWDQEPSSFTSAKASGTLPEIPATVFSGKFSAKSLICNDFQALRGRDFFSSRGGKVRILRVFEAIGEPGPSRFHFLVEIQTPPYRLHVLPTSDVNVLGDAPRGGDMAPFELNAPLTSKTSRPIKLAVDQDLSVVGISDRNSAPSIKLPK